MRSVLKLMRRNCLRNRLRAALTILGVAVAVVAFAFLRTVLAAYYVNADASDPTRLVTRHKVSLFNPLPIAARDKIAAVPGVRQVAFGNWYGGYYRDPKNFFAQFAIDPAYLDLYPEFVLPADQRQQFGAELEAAVIGRKLANRFGWRVGDRIPLHGTFYPDVDVVIRGIYDGRSRTTDETAMFFRWKLLDEKINRRGLVGWYLLGIDVPDHASRIMRAVDDLFANSTAPTHTETEKDFNLSFVSMMGGIITVVRTASWIVIGIVLLIMANIMAMAARERTTEYGVLKTLGFRNGHLAALIGGEAILLALLGAGLGCLLAYGAISGVGKYIEMTMGQIFPVFELTLPTIAMAVGLALAAGLLASAAPIRRMLASSVAQSLRPID
jgi:putative ABC transport system permease protein